MLISTSSTFVFVALAFGVTSTFGAPIPSNLLEAREILTGVTARSTQPAARVLSPEPQTIGRRFPQPFSADDLKSRDLFARRSRDLKSRLERPQSRTPDDEVDPRATVIVITDDDKGGQGTGKGTQRKGKGKGKGCKCSKKKKRPCKGGKGGRPGLGSPLSPGSTGLPESSPPMPVPDGSPNMPHSTIPTTEKQDKSPSDSTTPGPGINGGEGHSSHNSTTTTTAESGQPTPPVDAGERKRRLFARLKETRSTGARSLRSLHNRSPS